MLTVEVDRVRELWFAPGDPVRAASAIARLGDGWLVAQDDTTAAAWWRPDGIVPVRLFPPVQGHDRFDPAAGTKRLKPDVEAACEVAVDGRDGVLLLGSGSLANRTRAAVVTAVGDRTTVATADLSPLHRAVATTLGLDAGVLNLEAAVRVGPRLRLFHRGHARVPSASVDVATDDVVAAVRGRRDPATLACGDARRYALGDLDGRPLAITDALMLPDGRLLVAAAAEDAPDAVADGPVTGSALALVDDADVRAVTRLPAASPPWKVEGLALVASRPDGAVVLAVVDADDPSAPSLAIDLRVRW